MIYCTKSLVYYLTKIPKKFNNTFTKIFGPVCLLKVVHAAKTLMKEKFPHSQIYWFQIILNHIIDNNNRICNSYLMREIIQIKIRMLR